MNDWSDEETDDPHYADLRNFYKVEAWSLHCGGHWCNIRVRCLMASLTLGRCLTVVTKISRALSRLLPAATRWWRWRENNYRCPTMSSCGKPCVIRAVKGTSLGNLECRNVYYGRRRR